MRSGSWCAFAAIALALGGCSTDGGSGLITSSVTQPETVAAKPKVDAACPVLNAKINALREEGTAERVYAVADGKGRMVNIKRDSIGKAAELDKLNREFQAKCSALGAQQTAAAPQPSASSAADTIAKAKAAALEAERIKTTAEVARKTASAAPKL